MEIKDFNPKTAIGAAKPNLSLIPPAAKLHLAAAMMDGAAKYGAYNWRASPVSMMTYLAGAERHLCQLLDGEDFDPVSYCHHAAHLMANGAIILDAFSIGNLIDDRPMPGAGPEMIRSFSAEKKWGP